MAPRSVNMVRHPRGSYMVIHIAVSGFGTQENKVQLIGAVIREQESRRKVPKSVLRAALERNAVLQPSCDSPNTSRRFALGSSMASWLAKTRRAPSRHRDARVYGHTTTATHKTSIPSPPPPFSSHIPPPPADIVCHMAVWRYHIRIRCSG